MRLWLALCTVSAIVQAGCSNSPPPDIQTTGDPSQVTAETPTTDRPTHNDPPTHNGGGETSTSPDPAGVIDPTATNPDGATELKTLEIQQLIETLGDPQRQLLAVDELAARGTEAVPALQAALDSDNANLRQRAIFALGRIGPAAKDALPKLKQIAQQSDSAVHRDTAAFAIDAIEEN